MYSGTVRSLRNNRLGPNGAAALAPGLAANGGLTKCVLCGNELGVEGWTNIFNALRDSPTSKIAEWDLYNEGIGPTIAKPLAEYLSVTGGLMSLDVRDNRIEGDGAERLATVVLESKSMEVFSLIPMKALRANEVTELNLSYKGLGPAEARVISSLLAVNGSLTTVWSPAHKVS